jgi:uncharacterized protein
MADDQRSRPSFEITHETEPSRHLVAGFSTVGLAGLTAVDYLTEALALEERGYVTAAELPAITPFETGTPRHHTRLFSRDDYDLTVLVNELFVPPFAAAAFTDAVLDWTEAHGVEEITVLSGVPVAHGPDEHRAFYVATEDYQAARLDGTDVPAMGTGFLDGVNASLVGRGMDSDLRVGILVTPVHVPAPDVQASLRLVDTIDDLLGLDVDTAKLEGFATEVEQYYAELAERFEQVEDEQRGEDRMYM